MNRLRNWAEGFMAAVIVVLGVKVAQTKPFEQRGEANPKTDSTALAHASKVEMKKASVQPPMSRTEETKEFRSYYQRLDALRMREGVDVVWTLEAKTKVEEVRAKDPSFVESAIVAADCGKTMCREEAKHKNDKLGQRFMMMLAHNSAGIFSGGSAYIEPDTNHTISYFSRTGARLPSRYDRSW
jgi:hypothetical protein